MPLPFRLWHGGGAMLLLPTLRARFAYGFLGLLALACASPAQAETARLTKRPNVLFVISDDLSARISPAGYDGVQTPVLDRLAKESTTFRRAYCQYPVCGPTRASFLSGLYPESTGVFDNRIMIEETRPGTPTLPRVFREAGYWTASVGKVFHKSPRSARADRGLACAPACCRSRPGRPSPDRRRAPRRHSAAASTRAPPRAAKPQPRLPTRAIRSRAT